MENIQGSLSVLTDNSNRMLRLVIVFLMALQLTCTSMIDDQSDTKASNVRGEAITVAENETNSEIQNKMEETIEESFKTPENYSRRERKDAAKEKAGKKNPERRNRKAKRKGQKLRRKNRINKKLKA